MKQKNPEKNLRTCKQKNRNKAIYHEICTVLLPERFANSTDSLSPSALI